MVKALISQRYDNYSSNSSIFFAVKIFMLYSILASGHMDIFAAEILAFSVTQTTHKTLWLQPLHNHTRGHVLTLMFARTPSLPYNPPYFARSSKDILKN